MMPDKTAVAVAPGATVPSTNEATSPTMAPPSNTAAVKARGTTSRTLTPVAATLP